jgi:hypothetical protein
MVEATRILVVDDELNIAELVLMALKAAPIVSARS